MHNLEKNISFSWFRNTLNVTVQFFENSETVLFSFKIMHQQCSLKFQENVLIGCPEKKSQTQRTIEIWKAFKKLSDL